MDERRGYGLLEDADWSLGVATEVAAAAAVGAMVMMCLCRITSELSVINTKLSS